MKKAISLIAALTMLLGILSFNVYATAAPVAKKLDLAGGYFDTANFSIRPANAQAASYTHTPSYSITNDGWLKLEYFGDGGYLVSNDQFQGDFTCQFSLRNFDVSKTKDGFVAFAFGLPSKDAWWPSSCIVTYDGTTNGYLAYNPGVLPSSCLGEPANGSNRFWGAAGDVITFASADEDEGSVNSIVLKYVWDNTAKTLSLYTKNSTQTDFSPAKVFDKMVQPAFTNGYIGLGFTGEATLEVKDFTVVASKEANALNDAVSTYKAIQPTSSGTTAASATDLTDNSFTAKWNAMAGATSYAANLFDKDGKYIKTVTSTSASVSFAGLTKDAQYQVQVMSLDAFGGAISYLAPLSVTVKATPNSQPTSSQPTTSTPTTSKPTTNNPKTADNSFAWIMIVLCAAGFATFFIAKKVKA